ncbi:MAG TPA: glycosyltransferase [Candidatus Limnocylindrales bacterium]|nr:glycosyltransferase [Candidatus Limnocylindrales bacterium]
MPNPLKGVPKILYLVYWGAAEPLGQSLVLPSVARLAKSGVNVTLVTFEKPEDLAHHSEMAKIRAFLEERGVYWIPLRYHKRPKVPAKIFDILQGCAYAIMARLRVRPDIIHARTFIGGLIGFILVPLLQAKLVYHNEGFYPDEQVDGGIWKANSLPHRIAKFLEQQLYTHSHGIIALSYRARKVIQQLPAVQRKSTPVIVVPSCVDLDHFPWNPSKSLIRQDMLRFVYIGSVGGRYLFDKIGRFVALASREINRIHFRVLTRAEPDLIDSTLQASGLPAGSWSVVSVPHTAIPQELSYQQAGLFFLAQGISEHGCSPTKIGEYWASGLPVVTTPNVSDTDDIIRRERVGVIVKEHSDIEYRQAARELRSLLEDRGLSLRCRRAAETHYALEPACERQLTLYQSLISCTTSFITRSRV